MKKSIIFVLSSLALTSGVMLAQPVASQVINLNTADQTALAAITGIGKAKANTIIQYRKDHGPFKELHDLTRVKGISEKSLQNILKRNPNITIEAK